MMRIPRASFRTCMLASALTFAFRLTAQTPAPAVDPAIAGIAARIAAPIREQQVTKVIVAALRTPEDAPHPAGKWLAGQLSQALVNDFPDLAVLTPPEGSADFGVVGESAGNTPDSLEADRMWARNLGANVVVTGVFARKGDGIGLSLWAVYSSGLPRLIVTVQGAVPLPNQIATILPEPISPMDTGAARAGVNGASVPECIDCPAPHYSAEANKAGLRGSVILQVKVKADGHARNIMVVKGPGMGLEEEAIKAVRRWKFKPAMGANGKPAAVIVPIEVTFRWYKSPNVPPSE